MQTRTMAFGGNNEDCLSLNHLEAPSSTSSTSDKSDEESMYYEQYACSCESKSEDFKNSSDSLSSSTSMSDSDLTSSEDSLALSESESITDVTPLNSPYCDSPLPQGKYQGHRHEEKPDKTLNHVRSLHLNSKNDVDVNVLMKAIEKLEVESNQKVRFANRGSSNHKKKSVTFSEDEARRIEQENQRLYKRALSQQSKIKALYAVPNQIVYKNLSSSKHQELRKSDGDITVLSKKAQMTKVSKEGRNYSRRQQKCLSHPSSYNFPCSHLANKILLGSSMPNKVPHKCIHNDFSEASSSAPASSVTTLDVSKMQE